MRSSLRGRQDKTPRQLGLMRGTTKLWQPIVGRYDDFEWRLHQWTSGGCPAAKTMKFGMSHADPIPSNYYT